MRFKFKVRGMIIVPKGANRSTASSNKKTVNNTHKVKTAYNTEKNKKSRTKSLLWQTKERFSLFVLHKFTN